ncbi:hypothetical protein [Kosakonia sp. S42]|uniref:hypothetical protein n=1 Tax=Kosakonia sp. S42 TaxID=2767458 RepID=UPI00190DEA4E|nr:hypothetical protein [Kosakonia sp. S42]MBK0018744.1 hypothetical protein [Kosakonia sp. S42]
MRYTLLSLVLMSLFCPAVATNAEMSGTTESDYLQHRATELNKRIDTALSKHRLSGDKAAELHLSVGQVQTLAGHLQIRNGRIERPDADRMNQQLTDVERALTRQP